VRARLFGNDQAQSKEPRLPELQEHAWTRQSTGRPAPPTGTGEPHSPAAAPIGTGSALNPGGVTCMPTSLDDARDKLRWAEQHLEALRREIEPFEEANPYRISVNIDHDAGEYVFYVHDLPDLSPDWSLRIGDCAWGSKPRIRPLIHPCTMRRCCS
jgi:hypothetical protein